MNTLAQKIAAEIEIINEAIMNIGRDERLCAQVDQLRFYLDNLDTLDFSEFSEPLALGDGDDVGYDGEVDAHNFMCGLLA
jgi:hypothetical protein